VSINKKKYILYPGNLKYQPELVDKNAVKIVGKAIEVRFKLD